MVIKDKNLDGGKAFDRGKAFLMPEIKVDRKIPTYDCGCYIKR